MCLSMIYDTQNDTGVHKALQAEIKRQGDWAFNCTSGHDLERQFTDIINDGFLEQLVLVPMREEVILDSGHYSTILTLPVE